MDTQIHTQIKKEVSTDITHGYIALKTVYLITVCLKTAMFENCMFENCMFENCNV